MSKNNSHIFNIKDLKDFFVLLIESMYSNISFILMKKIIICYIVNSSEALSCDCLPSCSELQYEINVNKAPRNLSQDLVYQSKYENFMNSDLN